MVMRNFVSSLPEVVGPACADVGLQRNAYDLLYWECVGRIGKYLRCLSSVAAGDQEVGSQRHAVLQERPQHAASKLIHWHAHKSVAERFGAHVLVFDANLQAQWQPGK